MNSETGRVVDFPLPRWRPMRCFFLFMEVAEAPYPMAEESPEEDTGSLKPVLADMIALEDIQAFLKGEKTNHKNLVYE